MLLEKESKVLLYSKSASRNENKASNRDKAAEYPSALEVLLKYDGFTCSNLKLTIDLRRNSDKISATVDIIKYS